MCWPVLQPQMTGGDVIPGTDTGIEHRSQMTLSCDRGIPSFTSLLSLVFIDIIVSTLEGNTRQRHNLKPEILPHLQSTCKCVRQTVSQSKALWRDQIISSRSRDRCDRIRDHHRLKINSDGSCWSRKENLKKKLEILKSLLHFSFHLLTSLSLQTSSLHLQQVQVQGSLSEVVEKEDTVAQEVLALVLPPQERENTQQTPKPEAQEPEDEPPKALHSEAVQQVPLKLLALPQAVLGNRTTLNIPWPDTEQTNREYRIQEIIVWALSSG